MIGFRKSIRFELAKYIFVTMILFLAAILIFSLQYVNKFFTAAAEEQAEIVLHETDTKVNSFFNEIKTLSESLINYSAVYEVRIDEMRELFIANVVAREKYLRAIYLGTEEGAMHEWGVGEGFVDNTPTFPEGYNPVTRPWYKTALASDSHEITNPYLYASIDKIGITSVNKVYDKNNRMVGVLGLDIMLETLNEFLNELEIPKNGKSVLISEDGFVIASQFGPSENTVLHNIFKSNLDNMILNESGRSQTNDGKEDYLFVYNKNRLTGWMLIIAYPYDSILSGLRKTLIMISIVYLFMTSILTLSLVKISSIVIIQPLEKMFKVMKKLESGDQGARVEVTSENELAVIGEQFNKLVGLVDEYSHHLEKKVEERTSEVIRLQRENTRLRIIEEKERIFSELHDSIGAKLTNINICNSVAEKLLGGDNPKLMEIHKTIDDNCNNAILELKDIVTEISRQTAIEKMLFYIEEEIPERLKLKNIKYNLKWKIRKKHFLTIINETAAAELIKMLDELLSNVLKHSEATCVDIVLFEKKKYLAVSVEDNGCGAQIDLYSDTEGSYGLKNIKQRIEKIGGIFEIDSVINKGTKVMLFLTKSVSQNE